MGSTAITRGLNSSMSLIIIERCISRLYAVGRTAWNLRRPFLIHGLKSMPMDFMFRINWLSDSSKMKMRHFSPLLHAALTNVACKRGEKCLIFIFEESESQFIRNMKSIGMDFNPWIKKGLLKFHAVRPTAYSLEMHLSMMIKLIDEFKPRVIAVDPISNLYPIGDDVQVRSMMMRLIDYAKSLQITGLFTNLSNDSASEAFSLEPTQMAVSSLMDAWLILKNIEGNGERNRVFSIIKSRGMAHSNQLREFVLSEKGIELSTCTRGPGECPLALPGWHRRAAK